MTTPGRISGWDNSLLSVVGCRSQGKMRYHYFEHRILCLYVMICSQGLSLQLMVKNGPSQSACRYYELEGDLPNGAQARLASQVPENEAMTECVQATDVQSNSGQDFDWVQACAACESCFQPLKNVGFPGLVQSKNQDVELVLSKQVLEKSNNKGEHGYCNERPAVID